MDEEHKSKKKEKKTYKNRIEKMKLFDFWLKLFNSDHVLWSIKSLFELR